MNAHQQVDEILGEFTSLILFEIDLDPSNTFMEIIKQVQKRLLDDIDNRAVDGIDILRKINSKGRNISIPVVFTSVLGVATEDNKSWLGKSIYELAQTPQVWIDNQVIEKNGELIIYWSYLEELFKENIIKQKNI